MSKGLHFLRRLYAPTSRTIRNQPAQRRRSRRWERLEDRLALSATPSGIEAFTGNLIYDLPHDIELSGDTSEHVEVAHADSLELESGTFATWFGVNSVEGRQTVFSKDHSGLQDGGHLTAQIVDGRVEVRFQSNETSIKLYSADESITAGKFHHLAVSFGEDGFRLFVDGKIADARVDFTQDITENENSLVLGASTKHRNGEQDNLKEALSGMIESFQIYAGQYSLDEMAALAGATQTPLATPTEINGVAVGTDRNDFIWTDQFDALSVSAGYGQDYVIGSDLDERLDGGHGLDLVFGGKGDDLLVSRSDGREPIIDQLYDAGDDPYGEVDSETRTVYADQPIASDDFLVGGEGADTYRFEILINAKERILFKHVNDDGTIDWKGVTGENDNVHDHWVDRIGDEVIFGFNRDEGDKIEVVGHTVDVYRVTHVDSDGDGALDASVMYLQSNQGNAGAHNKDKLGTITVYGDLVMASDYTVDAHANLGIVETIGELAEAMAPKYGSPVVSDGESFWLRPTVYGEDMPEDAIFSVGQALQLDGDADNYVEVQHHEALALDNGTFAVSFTADAVAERQTLFSKDHSGLQDGGHLTAQLVEGRIEVRLQSAEKGVTLHSADNSIVAGQEHHVAVSFGADGFRLFVDGRIADARVDFEQGIAANENSLVVGASTKHRDGERLNLKDAFAGAIHQLAVYDQQFSLAEMAALAGNVEVPLAEPTLVDGVLYGTDEGETLPGSMDGVSQIKAGYGDDEVYGTHRNDRLDGGHGQDMVHGGFGDDVLVSRSDGREPVIAQLYDADDDPYGEVDPATRTLYPEQPIASDDLLIGGPGADTFRFEILINAKESILFKHVNDDGTIDWQGVTGENNLVHDHWVDRIGDEVILDFSREDGDKIEVVGHTVDVYKLNHIDSDDDGVLDASVLYLQSNQGNAGAHNKDQLGSVTVYGDLVFESDYTVHAHANLGIVETIGELAEALAPRYGSPVETDGESLWLLDEVEEPELPQDALFAVGQPLQLQVENEDYLEVAHEEAFELDSGSIAVAFTADAVDGRRTLFSKDHSGLQDGGHITAQIVDGLIEVRLQSESKSYKLYSDPNSIIAGHEHEVVVSFGTAGFKLFVDGELADSELEVTQGIASNDNSLVVGASTKRRDDDRMNLGDFFAGTIHEVSIYAVEIDEAALPDLLPAGEAAGETAVDAALSEF